MSDPEARIKRVHSRDNPLLLRLRKLIWHPNAYRKMGEIWIEGDHLCSAYLARAGVVPHHAVVSEHAWQHNALVRSLASAAQVVTVLADGLLEALSPLESAPPIAFVVPWKPTIDVKSKHATVILDRLQDAGNVGAVLRSAAAFGFSQVIALKGTAALWSPKVLRAGMGAHFGLHLVEAAEVAQLGALQVPLLATSSHADRVLPEVRLPWPCAWVLGHEGQGICAPLLAQCSLSVRIPQPGGEESLNVAAATAICLYESARQQLN